MIAKQQQAWRCKREEEEEVRSRAAVHHHDPGPLSDRRNTSQHRDGIEVFTVVDGKTAYTRLEGRGVPWGSSSVAVRRGAVWRS